jgi:hypothetical protein
VRMVFPHQLWVLSPLFSHTYCQHNKCRLTHSVSLLNFLMVN